MSLRRIHTLETGSRHATPNLLSQGSVCSTMQRMMAPSPIYTCMHACMYHMYACTLQSKSGTAHAHAHFPSSLDLT